VGDLFGRPQAADPPAIDLDVADPAVVDEMLGHVPAVGGFSSGAAHGPQSLRQAGIGAVGRAVEWLLEECDAGTLPGIAPRGCSFATLAEDLAGVYQQDTVRPQPLARGIELGNIASQGRAEWRPAEFGCSKAAAANLPCAV